MKKILTTLFCIMISIISIAEIKRSSNAASSIVMKENAKLYDAKVEYIQSSGTQWIDSGIVPILGTSIRIVMSPLKQYSSFENCFCGASDAAYSVPHYDLNARSGCITIWTGNYFFNTSVPLVINRIYDIIIDASTENLKVTIDGTQYATERRFQMYSKWSMYIFTLNNQGEALQNRNVEMRLYRFCMYDSSSNVIRDFIPVRFKNESNEDEGAMYDFVSKQLFRNQGKGSFIIGPDKE